MQYFYIVGYTLIGNDLTLCKVSLNEHTLMSWARREATKYDFRTYELYKQPITRMRDFTKKAAMIIVDELTKLNASAMLERTVFINSIHKINLN